MLGEDPRQGVGFREFY